MGKILCATRGGQDSYRTQDAAIALAQERGDSLIFLYVVDVRFLDKTSAPIVVDVEGEIGKMGEFLLVMAQERAAKAGVGAETVCREGRVGDQLVAVARELEVSTLVLGRPGGEDSTFSLDALQDLAASIRADADAEVVIV
jgi:nucleotide-binding universal stress UspA family protein